VLRQQSHDNLSSKFECDNFLLLRALRPRVHTCYVHHQTHLHYNDNLTTFTTTCSTTSITNTHPKSLERHSPVSPSEHSKSWWRNTLLFGRPSLSCRLHYIVLWIDFTLCNGWILFGQEIDKRCRVSGSYFAALQDQVQCSDHGTNVTHRGWLERDLSHVKAPGKWRCGESSVGTEDTTAPSSVSWSSDLVCCHHFSCYVYFILSSFHPFITLILSIPIFLLLLLAPFPQ